MIHVRCESRVRRRSPTGAAGDDWLQKVLACAHLQARSVVEHKRKLVPLWSLADGARTALSLYEAGVLELLTWDEKPLGKVRRVRQADLSLMATQALIGERLLPSCFASLLVSHDLLREWIDVTTHDDDGLLEEEFACWLACGGLNPSTRPADQRTFDDVQHLMSELEYA